MVEDGRDSPGGREVGRGWRWIRRQLVRGPHSESSRQSSQPKRRRTRSSRSPQAVRELGPAVLRLWDAVCRGKHGVCLSPQRCDEEGYGVGRRSSESVRDGHGSLSLRASAFGGR